MAPETSRRLPALAERVDLIEPFHVMELVKRLNDTLGLTSIVVTHHVHETLPVADHAIVIANGGIVFSGTPAQLEASEDPFVRQFLNGEPDGPIAFDAAPRNSEAA